MRKYQATQNKLIMTHFLLRIPIENPGHSDNRDLTSSLLITSSDATDHLITIM